MSLEALNIKQVHVSFNNLYDLLHTSTRLSFIFLPKAMDQYYMIYKNAKHNP